MSHELSRPLAQMGSEADLAIVEALEELERAYGSRAEFEAAAARLLARRDRLGEARRNVAGVLRLARLVADSTGGSVAMDLTRTELAQLTFQAVERVRSASLHLDARISKPSAGIVVTCDAPLMQACLTNILESAAMYAEPPGRLEIRLERQAVEAVVSVAAMTRRPHAASDAFRESLLHLVTKQIVDLHQGSLEQVDGTPHVTRLRLPLGLEPGRRRVPLSHG